MTTRQHVVKQKSTKLDHLLVLGLKLSQTNHIRNPLNFNAYFMAPSRKLISLKGKITGLESFNFLLNLLMVAMRFRKIITF